MASPISALTASATSGAGSTAGIGGSAPSEEMFLKLLVSQLQNQDPLNPTDSTQFVTQLAQFSQLEQLIAIRGDIEKAGAAPSTSQTPPAQNSSTSPVQS